MDSRQNGRDLKNMQVLDVQGMGCKIDSVKMGVNAKTALDPKWLRAEVLLLNTFSLTVPL